MKTVPDLTSQSFAAFASWVVIYELRLVKFQKILPLC
jgi:hypothetical protein